MTVRAMSDAQRRWLHDELRAWQEDGIVTAEQAARVLARYESVQDVGQRRRTQTAFVLQALAALLVFLATLLLIGYNWQELPRAAKLVTIFVFVAGTHAVGLHLRFKRNARLSSEVAFFFGCLLYGAGIWLVAQIFHLDVHYPDGFWWWALGVFPFALCLDTLLLHVLLVGLLAVWSGVEVFGFSHLSVKLLGRWGSLPNGAYTLPLLALPGLAWAYRRGSPRAVGLYAPLLAWWLLLQPIAWHQAGQVVWIIGASGALFLVVAEGHRAGSRFAIPYRMWGAMLTFGVLVPLTYYDFNAWTLSHGGRAGLSLAAGPLAILVLSIATFGGAEWLRSRVPARTDSAIAERSLLRRQWLPLSLALLMAFMASWTSMSGQQHMGRYREPWSGVVLLSTVLANVANVAFALWLVRLGVREGRGRPFSAGVAFFLLWTVLRYVDLFGDMGGMLGAAGLFFACAAVLFGLARYWRSRSESKEAA